MSKVFKFFDIFNPVFSQHFEVCKLDFWNIELVQQVTNALFSRHFESKLQFDIRSEPQNDPNKILLFVKFFNFYEKISKFRDF